MPTVHDVSAAIIERQHAAGRPIDKMQLQKLLYLVQGGHLRRTGRPAFRADFLAYRNGPVVPQVEETYRDLADDRAPLDRAAGGYPERLEADLQETVDIVLELFGGWTAPNLEHYSKRAHSPWRVARGDVPNGQPSTNVIPLADIARWFLTRPLEPNGAGGRGLPERAEQLEREADEDIAAGRVERFNNADEFLANLG